MSSSTKKRTPGNQKELPKNVVYCGPEVRSLGIQQYTTFKGGIPKYLDEHIEKCPVLKKLFVDVEQLGEFQKRFSEPSSSEQAFFNAAKSYFQEVK